MYKNKKKSKKDLKSYLFKSLHFKLNKTLTEIELNNILNINPTLKLP